MNRTIRRLAPVLASVVMLVTLLSYNIATGIDESGVDRYHRHILEVSEHIPDRIGPWVGVNEPVMKEAVLLLRPNVMFDRLYTRQSDGKKASILLVQCRDIRDMCGHYPPICYPANGWELKGEHDITLQAAGMDIPCVQYDFRFNTGGEPRVLTVVNFLVLPEGFIRDMDALRRAAGYRRKQPYGSGQVQLVVGAEISPEERRQMFAELVGGLGPVIEAIRAGGTK
jgi:hypothetical protein